MIFQFWLDHFLEQVGCGNLTTAKTNCIIELMLKDVNGDKIAPSNYVYPSPLKEVSLPTDSVEVC